MPPERPSHREPHELMQLGATTRLHIRAARKRQIRQFRWSVTDATGYTETVYNLRAWVRSKLNSDDADVRSVCGLLRARGVHKTLGLSARRLD